MNEDESIHNRPTSIAVVRPNQQRRKTAELLMPLQKLSLGFIFQSCGHLIGRLPLPFIAVTALMLLSSTGLIGLKLRDNVRDGYCPKDSRARRENQIYRNFLGSEGDPVMTTLLVQAKDNGSMHRIECLEETVRQWQYISSNLTVTTNNGGNVKFGDFCGHYCQANDPVKYFSDALKKKTNKPNTMGLHLSYPIATLLGYQLHLERNFFGVNVNESIPTDVHILEMTQNDNPVVTNIEYVKIISLAILAEVKTLEDFERLGKWELEVFQFCQNYTANPNNFLEIHVIGAEIVDTEMNKDAQKMTPYFIVGFSAMLFFVIVTVFSSAYYYGFAGFRMFFIGISCALVPTFAIITTLGLNNYLGFRTNSPMLIMPFLINGIGVNDAFLTLHAWMRQDPNQTPCLKLSNVLHEVGPSITTTTVTNVVVFLIGWWSPTEEMSIFCFGCALALFFAYLYTITFFCPLLVYVLNKHTHEPVKRTQFIDKFLHIYCKLICHKAIFALLIVGSLVYWGFGILGTIGIQAKLDTAKILPLDTPIRKPNRLIEEYVWKEFYPVTVLVQKPFNFSDQQMKKSFENLVGKFESSPECRGRVYTISWVRDYDKYFWDAEENDFDYEEMENTTKSKPDTVDYRHFDGFINHPVYGHHKGSMKLNISNEIPVQSFSMTFVFRNSTSWDDRINIMIKWRSFVDTFPILNASVWNVNAMFVDQMLSLKPLAEQNVTVTLICMAIVCLLFIQNPTSVITATLAILSISLGVTGYLSFWHLDLDPVSLCAVLVSIGMAVDFVAHTTYHYQIGHYEDRSGNRIMLDTSYLRVKYTLINIAWPMTQAGISTVLCILPLVHLQNYLPLVFVKTITLVVIWGLFHGLVLLPAILAQLPLKWFRYNLNNLLGFSSTSRLPSSTNSQEMMPLSTTT